MEKKNKIIFCGGAHYSGKSTLIENIQYTMSEDLSSYTIIDSFNKELKKISKGISPNHLLAKERHKIIEDFFSTLDPHKNFLILGHYRAKNRCEHYFNINQILPFTHYIHFYCSLETLLLRLKIKQRQYKNPQITNMQFHAQKQKDCFTFASDIAKKNDKILHSISLEESNSASFHLREIILDD